MIDLSLGHVRLPLEREPSPVTPVAEYGDPRGRGDLRAVLAARRQVPDGYVAVTTGSSMGITAALASRRPPIVLLPRPHYPAFVRIADLLGLKHAFYEALDTAGRPNASGAADLVRQHPGCTIIWNFPHNPTGSVDDPSARAEVLTSVADVGGEVIFDLVYGDLVYGDYVPISGVPSDFEVRTYSLSKSNALAGERVGYVVAPEGRRHEIERAHWALAMSPPATSQEMAVQELRREDHTRHKLIEALRSLRNIACDSVSNCTDITIMPPDGGIFLWATLPNLDVGSATVADLCRRVGVLLVPGSAFGARDHTAVRISFAVDEGALRRGIDLFIQVIDRLAKRGSMSK